MKNIFGKEAKSNFYLFILSSAIVLISLSFFGFVFATTAAVPLDVTTSAGITSLNVTEGVVSIINVTINNSDITPQANITQVNITLPAGFFYVSGSWGNTSTSARGAVANFTNTTTASFLTTPTVLTWQNFTNVGYIINSSQNDSSFWFKAVAYTPGYYNLSVLIYNGSANPTRTNITIKVISSILAADGSDVITVNEDAVNTSVINITVNNTRGYGGIPSTANISTVNISLLGHMVFTSGSDQVLSSVTNVTNASFTSTGNMLSWDNRTGIGYLINGSTNMSTFKFNITAGNAGVYNITVNLYNRTALVSSRNITLIVIQAPSAVTASTGLLNFSNVSEESSILLNITINNSYDDIGSGNISQVNITIPSSFKFVLNSNGTNNNTVANFTNTSTVLTWQNFTNVGYLINASANYTSYWFNVTPTVPGWFNITITLYNQTTITNKYLGIFVNDVMKPEVRFANFTSAVKNKGNYSKTSTNSSLVLNVSISDDGIIDTVIFNITNGTGGGLNASYRASNYSSNQWWNTSLNPAHFRDGRFNITVFVNDTSGNFNETTLQDLLVTFDSTIPTASITCTPTQLNTGDTVTCSCSGSDLLSGVNYTSWTANPSTANTGTHTTVCSVEDQAGNPGSGSTTYTVELGSSAVSSGSGGGGSSASFWTAGTFTTTSTQLQSGYTKEFSAKQRVTMTIAGGTHHVGIKEITSTTATIEIASTPVSVKLDVGGETKVDLDADGVYDVYVKLNSITGGKADVTIKSISEKVPVEKEGETVDVSGGEILEDEIPTTEESGGIGTGTIATIIIIILVILIASAIGMRKRNR